MASDVYSLDGLAQKVGIHPRTIRSYIQQGLLRGPESMGRNAHYTDYHLKRLEVIKTLNELLTNEIKTKTYYICFHFLM